MQLYYSTREYQAFCDMATDTRTGLESGKAYDMSSLLKNFSGCLEKYGIHGHNCTKQSVKLRMKSHFGETTVFHQPYHKTSRELVYSRSISLKYVINAAANAHNSAHLEPST